MFKSILGCIFFVILFVAPGLASADPALFLNDRGVALEGTDPVAYFTEHKKVAGLEQYSATWQNAKYWFSSEKNRALFQATPANYVAQYGGFCAYAVSIGRKAPGDPAQWKVVGGKLYLNYNANIKKIWETDEANAIKKADAKWDEIKDERP
jgi:YHS domain-containing protein